MTYCGNPLLLKEKNIMRSLSLTKTQRIITGQERQSTILLENAYEDGFLALDFNDPNQLSGKWESPIYFDTNKMFSLPQTRELPTFWLCQLVMSMYTDNVQKKNMAIAGVASSGTLWGASVAQALHMPFIEVCSQLQANQSYLSYIPEPHVELVVVDNVITTGKSLSRAIQKIRDATTCSIAGAVALFNYNFQRADLMLASMDLRAKVVSDLFAFREFLDSRDWGIARKNLDIWHADPVNWNQ